MDCACGKEMMWKGRAYPKKGIYWRNPRLMSDVYWCPSCGTLALKPPGKDKSVEWFVPGKQSPWDKEDKKEDSKVYAKKKDGPFDVNLSGDCTLKI